MKKIMSIVLVMTFLLLLTGCNGAAQATTPKEIINNISQVDVGTVVVDMGSKVGNNTLGIRMTIETVDSLNAQIKVEVKLVFPDYKIMTKDYELFTNINYVNGSSIYINMSQVMDFLISLDSQFVSVESYLGLTGDYLMITKEDLAQIISIENMDLTEEKDEAKIEADRILFNGIADAFMDVFGDALDEYSKTAGPDIIKVSENKIIHTITTETFKQYYDGITALDFEMYFNNLAVKIDEVRGDNVASTSMAEMMSEVNVNELFPSVTSTALDIGVGTVEKHVIKAGTNGNSVVINVTQEGVTMLEDKEYDFKGTLNITTKPNRIASVSVPSSVMSYSSFIRRFYDIVQSFYSQYGFY